MSLVLIGNKQLLQVNDGCWTMDAWPWTRDDMIKWVRQAAILFAGSFIVILGVVILPLPGPFGTPVILLGLAVLGSKFSFARRWKERFFNWIESRTNKKGNAL